MSMPEVSRGEIRMLINMIASVRGDLRDFRTEHERLHESERKALVISRRWLIGTVLTVAALIETPLLYLLTTRK